MKASLHTETGEKMHVYEVGYLMAQSVPEAQLPHEVGLLRALIERHGGVIISDEFPKLIELTYTMYKSLEASKEAFDEAYFGSIKFEMPTTSAAAFEKEFGASKNILRFLLVKTVRENTMFSERVQAAVPAEGESAKIANTKGSQEEIDKSIDALVIS